MNEEGWGLKDVLIFLAIISVALLVSMVIYRKTFTEIFDNRKSANSFSSETYADIETNLERIARTYTDNYYYKALENGDEGVVTIRDMQAENLLTEVKDIENDKTNCTGYVRFRKEASVTNYTAYLNCGDNYQTEGYQSKYDEPIKSEKEIVKDKVSG